jgi:hypothetical protein
MFNKRITAALFAIAIASSLIVASGFVGSAYAAKKVKQHLAVPFSGFPAVLDKDKSISLKSHTANAGDSDWTIGDANGISTEKVNIWKEECNE